MKELEQRFWENVDRGEGCWNWKTGLHSDGYGRLEERGKKRYAHRISWEIHNGAIPKGKFVCHRCDNPRCVNPDHLFLGSNLENIRDRDLKKRSNNGQPKVSDDVVRQIRQLCSSGMSKSAVARQLNLSVGTVGPIALGKRRKFVA